MHSKFSNELNLGLFLFTLICSLMVRFEPNLWSRLGDPYDYLHQSTIELTDIDFYIPKKTSHYYPRPFTVPLFYKIANADTELVLVLQKVIHGLSCFFCAFAILLYIKHKHIKIIFLVTWYLFMMWWNIVGWSNTILSESISISLLFMWLGSFLLFKNKKTILTFIFHILITILFSFTRDSWPYILIAFYTLHLLASFKLEKPFIVKYSMLFGFSIILFFTQQYTAKVGMRYKLPVLNNIVFTILPNPEYVEWFEKEGLPCVEALKKDYSNIPIENFRDIYPLYTNDTSYAALHSWATTHGNTVYMKFLLSHPSQLFLLNETPENLERIFAYNLDYTSKPFGLSRISDYIFPLFNSISIILLLMIYMFICKKEKSIEWIFPTSVLIICILNTVLLYNADALEVERHLFITSTFMQFSGIYMSIFILDSSILNSSLKKIFKRKTT
jgi:hypothetical protein